MISSRAAVIGIGLALLAPMAAFSACSSSSTTGTGTGADAGIGTGSDGGSSATGPAPAGTLACTDGDSQSQKCSCVLASARTGACSPQTLNEPAHCCATIDSTGSTTQCDCQGDEETSCCLDASGSCNCATDGDCISVNGKGGVVTSCTAPSGGHCCMSENSCACTSTACATTETEVPSCAPQSVVLTCLSPRDRGHVLSVISGAAGYP